MGTDIHVVVVNRVRYSEDSEPYYNVRGIPMDYRCYGFFAAIAGVRNCFGFDPVKTEHYPFDGELQRDIRRFLSGNHSPRLLTLKELKGVDLNTFDIPGNSSYTYAIRNYFRAWIEFGEACAKQEDSDIPDEDVLFCFDFDS